MSTNYEPTPEQVEQMLREIRSAAPAFRLVSPELARVILKRQHEREKGLLFAIETAIGRICYGGNAERVLRDALAAHAALDAAPKPTLLEAAKKMADTLERGHWTDPSAGAIATAALALKAAVERAERAE